MKRAIAVCLVFILVFSLSGCMGRQAPTVPKENETTIEKMKGEKDSLDGLCKELRKKEFVGDAAIITEAEMIGALKGYRLVDEKDNSVAIELYEFDLKDTSDKGKETITSVQKSGEFEILEIKVKAQLSENGKYMLVYNDPKTEGDEPDEARVERKTNFLKIFNSWK